MSEYWREVLKSFPYAQPVSHPDPTAPTDGLWYTYRCESCRGIITKLEIKRAWENGQANLCECGGRRIRPTNATERDMRLDFEKLLELAYAIAEGRVAPCPPNDKVEDVMAAKEAAGCRDDGL